MSNSVKVRWYDGCIIYVVLFMCLFIIGFNVIYSDWYDNRFFY